MDKNLIHFLNKADARKSICHNAWITYRWGQVYVRSTRRYIDGKFLKCFDIASIEVKEKIRGKGRFTKWLEEAEKLISVPIFVENIIQDRFANFFLRRGYEVIDECIYPNCLIKR